MRVILQPQCTPPEPLTMGTPSRNRLQGLSNSTGNHKLVRAHLLRSSRKVHSLLSDQLLHHQESALPFMRCQGKLYHGL